VLAGYSGKAKNIEFIEDEKVKIIFRDSISAFDGVKLDELDNKGVINCKISTRLFQILHEYGLETHFISSSKDDEMICERVEIIPVETVCRNKTAGSFCRRYGVDQGIKFESPIIEYFLKNDDLHDPLVNKEVAVNMEWMNSEEAMLMKVITRAVNHILKEVFDLINLDLIDFKLEFGRNKDGCLLIADEISADTMRLWEKKTGEIKDKDRYRKDLGEVIHHYEDILTRLNTINNLPNIETQTEAYVNINLKNSVLDPAGAVTQRVLIRNQHETIETTRLGKNAKLIFSEFPSFSLFKEIKGISSEILSNPLIEDFEIELKYHS